MSSPDSSPPVESTPITFDFSDIADLVDTVKTMEKTKENIMAFAAAVRNHVKSRMTQASYAQHSYGCPDPCFEQKCTKCNFVAQSHFAIIDAAGELLNNFTIMLFSVLPPQIAYQIAIAIWGPIALFDCYKGFEILVSIQFFECFNKCDCKNLSVRSACLSILFTILSIIAYVLGFGGAVGLLKNLFVQISEMILIPAGDKLGCNELAEECFPVSQSF